MIRIASLLLAFSLAMPFAATADDTTETPAAAAAMDVQNPIGPAPAGKGQIVFYREPKFVGGGVGFKVREGENEIVKLKNGTYFVATVEPGKHEYNMHGEVKDVLPLEIEADETYYVKASISMGIVAGRPNLAPSDEAGFLAALKKLKPAKAP